MQLRYAPRYKRRLPVRFWHPESGDTHQAFTMDISLVGMFIGTRTPLPKGTRFRIEVLEPGHNYVFQGEVVRAARVVPELQRISPSGMGVRLLPVRELVQELIPAESERQPVGASNRTAQEQGSPPIGRAPGRYSMTTSASPSPAEEKAEEDPTPLYVLRFASPEVFLQIFLHHREQGGFFVPTRHPAAVGESIRVSFELQRRDVEPLELEGQVDAQLSESQDEHERPTGMRVTFLDPDDAMEQLRAMIRRLRAD
jgi:Tfp pilus assembly protein PilZ